MTNVCISKWSSLLMAITACLAALSGQARSADEIAQPVAVAILPFEDRAAKAGAKGMGPQITDLVFAELVAKPEIFLVDREDMSKTMAEQQINLTGAVNPTEAIQVGKLIGAKILVTGSIVTTPTDQYLIAKIISSETSRVLGESVKGKINKDKSDGGASDLVADLATKIAATISSKSGQLVAKAKTKDDRLAELVKTLGDKKRPVIMARVRERHVSAVVIDPAAQTELEWFAKGAGFTVIQSGSGDKTDVDILLEGEGFSEFGGRIENIASVKARVEVKAIDRRTGKVLAVDRQTSVALDLTEQIAGKTALQNAAAQIAERMLPKLISKD